MMDKVSQIICAKSLSDLRHIRDVDEYEALESLNHVISTLEKENKYLKKEASDLNEQLEKEQQKSRELIPQYKASVARLKKNTQLIRDKLKDIQEIRIKEKRQYEDKLQTLEESKKKLLDQNQTLKDLNKRLNNQFEESERLNAENTYKVKNLVMENPQASTKPIIHEELNQEGIRRAKRQNNLHLGFDQDQLNSEEDNYNDQVNNLYDNEKLKRISQKRQISTSRSLENFNISHNNLIQQKTNTDKPKLHVERILSHRSSYKPGRGEENWNEYQGRKSFSARKNFREQENTGVLDNKIGRTIGWEDDEGQIEGRRTLGLNKKNREEEIIEKDDDEEDINDSNDKKFRKYLSNDDNISEKEDENIEKPMLSNLKEEIFSLDNEIYEIQKLIKEELES